MKNKLETQNQSVTGINLVQNMLQTTKPDNATVNL